MGLPSPTETYGGPVVETFTETHYGVRSGIETGAAFRAPWNDPNPADLTADDRERLAAAPSRFMIADPDGTDIDVLDYIGCTVDGSIFMPGVVDPAEAVARVTAALDDAGATIVGTLHARPATEQRVVIHDGFGDDAPIRAVCYEHETRAVTRRSAYTLDYLPVDGLTDTIEAVRA